MICRGILTIICLLGLAVASSIWITVAMAGEYLEEFGNAPLNKALWEAKAEGKATYAIKNGQLVMTSPGVPDGILLYWRGSDISKEDFTVEIKAEVARGTDNAGIIAFTKKDLPPTLNTTINAEWKNMFWCGENTSGWYINDDNWTRTPAAGPEFKGVWKAEMKGGKISCYFNDKEVVTINKVEGNRFLCFGPDTYTSHYSGEMTIDWIRVSGESVTFAVEPEGKLSVTWGKLKADF